MDTGLVKKATILFPPDLYKQLAVLAKERKTSVGELVREACRLRYFGPSRRERQAAVAALVAMRLPVGTPSEMKAESVPEVEELP
jgi:hypothetical protein